MLIRMSDRVRFCDREVVVAGAFDSGDRRSSACSKRIEIASHCVPRTWKEHPFSGRARQFAR